MKRKILVTGGAGFIGGCLAERLCENPDNHVVIVDNLRTGSLDKLPSGSFTNWKFIKADVNVRKEISPVMTAYSFDYVFHYAALVGVKRTLENPVSVLHDIQGIQNILDLSKSTGVKRVFYSSSSEVYGEPVELPQNELTTPLNSRLPYAVVKNVGEAFCRSYKQEYDLDFTIFRFFNTYGPKQSEDFVMSKFIAAAVKGDPVTIYGDGKQTRTFCYIDDNLEACINAFENDLHCNDIINVGNNKEVTILELAERVIDICQSDSDIIYLPALKEGDMTRRQPDNEKMRVLLNRNLISLNEGMQLLLKNGHWIRSHETA